MLGAESRSLRPVEQDEFPAFNDEAGRTDGTLLEAFASFYQEVARLKRVIRLGQVGIELGRELPPSSSKFEEANAISARLVRKLDQQSPSRVGDARRNELTLEIAQYVMAVLADEVFLFELPEWRGREAWLTVLVEETRFGRSLGGTRFFRLLDGLLLQRSQGGLHADLGAIFLLAIQLGMKGPYRDGAGAAIQLAEYRDDLRDYVAKRRRTRPSGEHAFPQAYDYTVTTSTKGHDGQPVAQDESARRLAPLRPWLWGALLYLVGYFCVSTIAWIFIVGPVRDQISHLRTQPEMVDAP